jgi:hypothetical protein
MEDSGWESGARLPPTTNVTQQCGVPAPRIRGDFQNRDVVGGAYEIEELRRFIRESFLAGAGIFHRTYSRKKDRT